eukprot:577944-Pyramimonas_sp.AAC.1
MKPSRVDRAGRRQRQAALARAAIDANQHVIQSTDSDRTIRESLNDVIRESTVKWSDIHDSGRRCRERYRIDAAIDSASAQQLA